MEEMIFGRDPLGCRVFRNWVVGSLGFRGFPDRADQVKRSALSNLTLQILNRKTF